jgi:hypothetical protein
VLGGRDDPEGCFLLYADDRKYAGIQPLDEVRDQIERILVQQMSRQSERPVARAPAPERLREALLSGPDGPLLASLSEPRQPTTAGPPRPGGPASGSSWARTP